MKNKQVGFLIIGIAVVFFFVVMSYNNALQTITEQTCMMGEACPMNITIKTQEVISYGDSEEEEKSNEKENNVSESKDDHGR